jgi:Zn-dependent protease/CBS domain-containing protein
MRNGLSLGRVFGINIRIDWSWLVIMVLVTWNLSTVFADNRPSWSPGLRWGTAVVAARLFFVSLLAHEMAHSLGARRRGIPVKRITLFLFGGVSNIEREPDSPKSEFLITIVGPLMSFVIGIVLLLIVNVAAKPLSETVSTPTSAVKELGPLWLLMLWLGLINVLLAFFNLIPGFPLDGGRALRSILWAAIGDLRQATRWASGVGQFVAAAFIVIGVSMAFGVDIPFFGTGLIGGLWLIFIGWFLNTAAVQSYQQVVIQDVLEDVPVARIMQITPPTVTPDITVSMRVHDHVMQHDDHAFPVLEGTQLIGLVTLEDVRKVARHEWESVTVRQIMTPFKDLVIVTPEEEASSAWEKISSGDCRQLPVLRDGKMVGLLRRRDMVKWLHFQSQTDRL